MADTNQPIDDVNLEEEMAERQMTREQAEDYAKREQYGQSGDMLDTTMGNMGGAGAAGSGPDISKQSQPADINSSDLPKRP